MLYHLFCLFSVHSKLAKPMPTALLADPILLTRNLFLMKQIVRLAKSQGGILPSIVVRWSWPLPKKAIGSSQALVGKIISSRNSKQC